MNQNEIDFFERQFGLNELEHFGVKGMRWGIRRDRDYDQSSSRPSGSGDTKKKIKKTASKTVATTKSIGRGLSSAARSTARGSRKVASIFKKNKDKKVSKTDLSKMSDADLQALVNRIALEQRYDSLVNGNSSGSGGSGGSGGSNKKKSDSLISKVLKKQAERQINTMLNSFIDPQVSSMLKKMGKTAITK